MKTYKDTDNLIKVHNELACVYRQRRRPDDWQKAEEQFERSIALSEEFENQLALADNYEDISILYQRWMIDHLDHNREKEAEEYAEKTSKTVNKPLELANSISNSYLVAKATRTLGDLAFVNHDFNAAFDSYFEACLLMESAIDKTEASSPVVMRRGYREMVNRLQEQLL